MIKISNRLEEIANYVSNNSKIVDIGCDHGYLDIYLYENRENMNILAVDINENALNEAKKNIKEAGLDDVIETRISNGLQNVDTKEIETIIISGLGTHTIVGILYNDLSKLQNVKQIIIQSNTDIPFLRKRLTEIKYHIANEQLVEERGIIYTIIDFRRGRKRYNKKDLYFGPYLRRENSKLFQKKNAQDLEKLRHLYNVIPKKNIHHKWITYQKLNMYKKLK